MRTNIELDEDLLEQAMVSAGVRTKRATVEAALRLLVDTYAQGSVRALRGKIRWEGDLEESRTGSVTE